MSARPFDPITLVLLLALEGSPSRLVVGVVFLVLLVFYRWLER
jgi:di/tricarboxylate transporter